MYLYICTLLLTGVSMLFEQVVVSNLCENGISWITLSLKSHQEWDTLAVKMKSDDATTYKIMLMNVDGI